MRWLVQYRSAAWTDTGPSAWIDRVRPYVTATMDAGNEVLRDAGGADWTAFTRRRCTSKVTEAAAVVPPESPGTTTTANVQVIGAVRTTCSDGQPYPTEQAAFTLVMMQTAQGWLVDHRLF